MNYEKMLPIGTVLCLNGSENPVMIIGCNQVELRNKRLYDYSGVIFPMGYTDDQHVYIFDHENITKVYSVGYLDEESKKFSADALEENRRLKSGEMTIDELLGPNRQF